MMPEVCFLLMVVSFEMGYVRLRNFSKITRTSIDKLLEVVDEC